MRLANKCAVVTGGAQGIGLAIAKRLASEGARVAVLDLKAEAAHAALADDDPKHLGLACNVADSAAVDVAVAAIAARFGGVDILVNNAGIGRAPGDGGEQAAAARAERAAQLARGLKPSVHPDQVIHMSDDAWAAVLGVNLNGAFYCARAVIRDMVRRDAGGSIVNVSSTGAESGDGPVHYIASKSALVGLTRALSREVATRGIRVNAVLPGATHTPMMSQMPPAAQRAMEAKIPLGRAAQPEEIAAAVAFLASDEASYSTGASIAVNGGYYFC